MTTIRNLNYWIWCEDIEVPPSWLVMEVNSAHPVSLKALLYSPPHSSTSGFTINVIVASCLKTWAQFRRHFGLHTFSVGAPLSANHTFPPSLLDNTFAVWARLGIKTIRDMCSPYVDSIFASFQQLVDKFSLPKGQFF